MNKGWKRLIEVGFKRKLKLGWMRVIEERKERI